MAVLTSSVFCSSPMSWAYQASAGSNRTVLHCPPCSHNPQVVCQSAFDIQERKVPRRALVITIGLTTVVDAYNIQEAQAGKRKPAVAEEEKPTDDKDLSVYDAKLLATYRRKEAMKEALEKQKARGKKIGSELSAESKAFPVLKSEPEAPPTAVTPSILKGRKQELGRPLQVLEAVAPASD